MGLAGKCLERELRKDQLWGLQSGAGGLWSGEQDQEGIRRRVSEGTWRLGSRWKLGKEAENGIWKRAMGMLRGPWR